MRSRRRPSRSRWAGWSDSLYVLTGRCTEAELQGFYNYCSSAEVTWNARQYGCVHLDPPKPWRAALLCAMRPEGTIPVHRDAWGEGENPLLQRFHYVLETNKYCWSYHDGVWQQLEVGGIYQMDPRLEHASINFGYTERRHLILDR